MWELDTNHRAPIFNYPDFPLAGGRSMDIDDRLSFIVPNSNIESEGPYEFTGTMYPDKRQREYLCRTMILDPDPVEEEAEV